MTFFPLKTPLMFWFRLVLLALAAALVACESPDTPAAETPSAGAESDEKQIWTCSMHPSVRLEAPGLCPICNMDLIPAEQDGDGPWTLTMAPEAVKLAEVATTAVERRSIAMEIPMVGKVALDEKRVSDITAWVSGRIDRLFVDFTGIEVRQGDHMVELYSPELVTAQQELRQAKRSVDHGPTSLKAAGERRLKAARKKLALLGLADHQIQAIEARDNTSDKLTIEAPMSGIVLKRHLNEGAYVQTGSPIYTVADLSRVWIVLEAYESELAWLRYGQAVDFTVEAFPGETFHGRIVFIDPVLDPRTRTVKVRLDVANEDRRLKPDMFVSAKAYAKVDESGQTMDEHLHGKMICPMHPEVVKDEPGACDVCGMDLVPVERLGLARGSKAEVPLVIPRSAPLITGKRAVVYIADPEKPGRYSGREIVLGPQTPEHYVVLEGLQEGEQVVVNGAFKIDSELQIRAKSSMMYASANPALAKKSKPVAKSAAPAAFVAALTPAYQSYFSLQTALSQDDFAAAQKAVTELKQAVGALPAGKLDARSSLTWSKLGLVKAVDGLSGAEDINVLRTRFEPLSEAVYQVAKQFGYSDQLSIYRYHCPMAFDNRGADWLQAKQGTANPYYGAMMFGCGSEQEALDGAHSGGPGGSGHAH